LTSFLMVYDILRWEEKDVITKARELGANVRLLHLQSKPIRIGVNGFEIDIALQRSVSFNRALSSTLALESAGMHVVNSSQALMASEDKIWTHASLVKAGLPTPPSVLAYDVESALKAAETLGYPVVVKPVRGSWGRLVNLARDEEELRGIVEHRMLMGDHYKVIYLQKYIEKPNRDMRVFCLGGAIVAGIYRISRHWVTNTARGARAEPLSISSELEEMALRACEVLGVEFGGVDIVEDPREGYMVLEVNGVPEYRNTVRVTGVDVSKRLVEYLVERAQK